MSLQPLLRQARVSALLARSLPAYLRLRARGARADAAAWEHVHAQTARRVRDLVEDMGGLLTKFAQVVAARADVFPSAYVRELRRFHDAAPERPFAALAPVVPPGLRAALVQVDERPLAAASLAQVHAGRLRDGREVAIKLQYPEIAALARADLASARRVARVVGALQDRLDVRSLVFEIARFIELELDFEREADSTERIARAFAGCAEVRVPEVVRELSGPRVLVLERLDGIPLSDLERVRAAGHDLREVARRVGRLWAAMLFEHGFFHGDPHPGNLLVRADGSIALLDFGLCKQLPEGFAAGVARLLVAAAGDDGDATLAAARELGFEVAGQRPADLALLVRGLLGQPLSGALPDLMAQTRIRGVPEHFGLVARTLVLLNGLSHTLAPGERVLQAELLAALAPRLQRAAAATAS